MMILLMMIDFRILNTLIISVILNYILLITHYTNSSDLIVNKQLEIDSSFRKLVANPRHIGNIVEVATTSFLDSFTCTTVAVKAGFKAKACSASNSVKSSCVCECFKHQDPHPHIRTIVATCYYVPRPLDTISWCRVSVPVSDLPKFVQCRGGEHDPNHVISGGRIHEDKTG